MAFLEFNQVSFSYPQEGRFALRDIQLGFSRDGITAITGANGSGKTTLTKLMIGVLRSTRGTVCLEGRSLEEYSLGEIGRRIGYVFQNPDLQFFCSTVAEEISFGFVNQGCRPETVEEKIQYYLDYFELGNYRHVFPLHLSHGEKRRLAIASVLATEPSFLILDEPTTGLDAYRKRLLADLLIKIAGAGIGISLVSHDQAFVNRLAERVITLEKGRVVWDSGEGRKHG
ncbi:MAG: ABC transporter ATP-binding protein [Candidatus Syntrophopropionicum ammoniitolerans]